MIIRRRIAVGCSATTILMFLLVSVMTDGRSYVPATLGRLFPKPSNLSKEQGKVKTATDIDVKATEIAALTPTLGAPMSKVVGSKSQAVPMVTATSSPSETSPADRIIVMAKLSKEDTSWVEENLPDWQNAIYTVDNPNATLHTAKNKGREANAYLTYISENYPNFPSTIVFLHSHRNGYPGGWHTDAPNYDNVASVRSLNIPFIQQNGYANLRCLQVPGCPAEVQPFRDPPSDDKFQELAMPSAWFELFGNKDVPEVLATPCCAQFAVSKTQVLRRPRSDYQRYLRWLMETPLDDGTAGRVFEYLWHVIFGQDPVYCPGLYECYRDVYGRS